MSILERLFIVNPYRRPVFPAPERLEPLDEEGLVAIGGVLEPDILLEAYRKGIFPWSGEHPVPWYSPDPRMVLVPSEVKVRRTLQQTLRRGHLQVRFDHDFKGMMGLCGRIRRRGQNGTWITRNMVRCWVELHALGYAHSVEVVDAEGVLVGGLYGMAIGRAFFGESMASVVPDASKVALVHLCQRLDARGFAFIDCQQSTQHMASMGARDIPRARYLELVAEATGAADAWGAAE